MNRPRFSLPSRAPRHFLTWLSFPLLILVIVGFSWRPLAGGDDFWAHAAIGRWIWEHHHVPTRTLFLWSDSVPWIAHAWGTGVWFATLLRWGGERNGPLLAQIFNSLMCIAPFALLWRYWRQNAPFSSFMAPIFILAIWVSAARFHPRPELFSALFLTILMIFLAHWPRQKTLPKLQIAGIAAMFALWPNFHGVVALGLVFLYIAALAELWQARGDNRLLLLALVCTLLMFICNPRGFAYYKVLIPIGSRTFDRIDEWKPFWKFPTLAAELWVGELILWALGMFLWLRNPHRRLMQLGWMLLMLAAFLKARRQLWLTALTSLLVVVTNLRFTSDDIFRGWRRLSKGDISQPMPAPMRLIARGGVLVMLACALAMAFPQKTLTLSPRNPNWPLRPTAPNLPAKMAAFVRDEAPPGRIFNDYEFSAYLEWALHGQRALYIDLNNAYRDELMDEYFEAQASAPLPAELKTLDSRRDQILARQKGATPKALSAQNAQLARISTRRALVVQGWNAANAKLDAKRAQILARRKIKIVALRPYTSKESLSILGAYVDKNPAWKRIYRDRDGTVWARK